MRDSKSRSGASETAHAATAAGASTGDAAHAALMHKKLQERAKKRKKSAPGGGPMQVGTEGTEFNAFARTFDATGEEWVPNTAEEAYAFASAWDMGARVIRFFLSDGPSGIWGGKDGPTVDPSKYIPKEYLQGLSDKGAAAHIAGQLFAWETSIQNAKKLGYPFEFQAVLALGRVKSLPNNQAATDNDPKEYRLFVEAVVTALSKMGVHRYSILNEPNLITYLRIQSGASGVVHTGTGTGTLAPGGSAKKKYKFTVTISASGTAFTYTDGSGKTSSETPLPTSASASCPLLDLQTNKPTGANITASGAFKAGDTYAFSVYPDHKDSLADRARKYRELYGVGNKAAHEADPHDPKLQVLMGELAGGVGGAPDFLKDLMHDGKGPMVTEGFALHPYYDPLNPHKGKSGAEYMDMTNLPRTEQLLQKYHAEGKLETPDGKTPPLFLSEFGLFEANSGDKMGAPTEHAVPEAERARLLRHDFAEAHRLGVKEMTQYMMFGDPPGSAPGTWDTGVMPNPAKPGEVTPSICKTWSPAMDVQAGDVVAPGRGRKQDVSYLYVAQAAGTTGTTQPKWGSETIADGTVTWKPVNPATPPAGAADGANHFGPSGLALAQWIHQHDQPKPGARRKHKK